ncbi:hypothetical protein KUCAC02_002243, partial [Chaenocephalus aceratus]
ETLTWQCHPAEPTSPRGPGLFVCLAQRMTPCHGDGEVTAAPDLTSHPSFCLMPGHWG